jgi:hypothetical protein
MRKDVRNRENNIAFAIGKAEINYKICNSESSSWGKVCCSECRFVISRSYQFVISVILRCSISSRGTNICVRINMNSRALEFERIGMDWEVFWSFGQLSEYTGRYTDSPVGATFNSNQTRTGRAEPRGQGSVRSDPGPFGYAAG